MLACSGAAPPARPALGRLTRDVRAAVHMYMYVMLAWLIEWRLIGWAPSRAGRCRVYLWLYLWLYLYLCLYMYMLRILRILRRQTLSKP